MFVQRTSGVVPRFLREMKDGYYIAKGLETCRKATSSDGSKKHFHIKSMAKILHLS